MGINQAVVERLKSAWANLPESPVAMDPRTLADAAEGVRAVTLDVDAAAADELLTGEEAVAASTIRRWGGVIATRHEGVTICWEHTQETGFLTACAGLLYPWTLGLTPQRAQGAGLISVAQMEALCARSRRDYESWRSALAANAPILLEIYGGAEHPARKLSEW
jgi:hypothetical protein